MISRRHLFGCLCGVSLLGKSQLAAAAEGGEANEKHSIYMLLTCGLVAARWRIRRSNPEARAAYAAAFPGVRFSEYFGHNIGALLLGPADELVAFRMNDATFENSSLAHAEVRVVEAGNKWSNRQRFKEGQGTQGYSTLFEGCTVYSTLESCTQCYGVMHLAGVDRVVYAQVDSLQQDIGGTIFKLHEGGPLPSVRPIRADFFPIFTEIAKAFEQYQEQARLEKQSLGTTAFLSSVFAFKVFRTAGLVLDRLTLQFPQNRWHKERAVRLLTTMIDPDRSAVVME